jgi:hypothetical protein
MSLSGERGRTSFTRFVQQSHLEPEPRSTGIRREKSSTCRFSRKKPFISCDFRSQKSGGLPANYPSKKVEASVKHVTCALRTHFTPEVAKKLSIH